ncbi:DUF2069 domain-containing protein [Nitrincola tibetensis]|uniref:DUF2069 domain-containing protein n=1 Tax=Nitrincola tibetensis TaxID=2219697 RepID=A0A364NKV9_9GAMM|nr:DUF2069 domain-containing protein [Nitrincola tibetensis]RAU17702.1 DUF2069 domain-containing protein [Nitrincola tibetensis]
MTLAQKANISHKITIIAYISLLLLFTLWYLWLAPAKSDHPWVIWLVHVLPLLAFSPKIFRGHARGHAWFCFILLFYFLGSVLATLMPLTRWLGLIESILLCILFTSSMMFARWQSQIDRGLV